MRVSCHVSEIRWLFRVDGTHAVGKIITAVVRSLAVGLGGLHLLEWLLRHGGEGIGNQVRRVCVVPILRGTQICGCFSTLSWKGGAREIMDHFMMTYIRGRRCKRRELERTNLKPPPCLRQPRTKIRLLTVPLLAPGRHMTHVLRCVEWPRE